MTSEYLVNRDKSDTIEKIFIGNCIFKGCLSVQLSFDMKFITEKMFFGCITLREIKILSSITRICKFAFYKCNSLSSIEIPSSVTLIDRYAFCDCRSLKRAIIPSSVKFIGHGAFNNCFSLKKLSIPSSLNYIENIIFKGCISLEVSSDDGVIQKNIFNKYSTIKKFHLQLKLYKKMVSKIVHHLK